MVRKKKQLDKALNIWKRFHSKNPREIITVKGKGAKWPSKWGVSGTVTQTLYASDKWNRDGDFDEYYHDHGPGTIYCWEPVDAQSWVEAESTPFKQPTVLAVLAKSQGWTMNRVDTGEQVQASVAKDCLLCCDPEGTTLFILNPRTGFEAVIYGDGLTVEREGICG